MVKQILTLDNLYQFYLQKNETITFSSKEAGKPIVVTTNGFFESDESDMPGMLKLKLKVCHTETNRNGSHISKENMEKAMPTLKYRPILAYIHELEDGTKDFYAHNIEIIENEDGESEVNYIESQVGCFTADNPWLEYDKKMDKTYVMAYAVIPEEYTEAADIICRKGGTKVSCELVINELSYNAKEKYLDLTDFYFGGTTLLGCDEDGNEIGEGMLGSRADIDDFCCKEPTFTYQEKMIEILDRLNTTLSNFNKDTIQKGGNEMNKFEELLKKYGKTVEDIEFEYSNMTDEELEAKFAELFDGEGDSGAAASDSDNGDTSTSNSEGEDGADVGSDPEGESTTDGDNGIDPQASNDDDDDGDDDEDNDDGVPAKKKKIENSELRYELSHDDIRYALYNLISALSDDGYCTTWIAEVYDDKFIYEDYAEGKCYRQKYSKDGDNVELNGEPVEVFSEWLSKEEKEALDALKAEYATLKSFKEKYDAAELKAEKDAILESAEYAEIKDSDEFKALVAEADNYSVEELKIKADLLFAASMKKKFNFEAEKPEKKHAVGINFNAKPNKKKQAYGGIFANEN